MALRLRMKLTGVTPEQYDAAHAEMALEASPPPGLIFHCAVRTEDGWDIVDVWESMEHFEEFAVKTLAPAYAKLGPDLLPGPTVLEEHPVYNYVVPR